MVVNVGPTSPGVSEVVLASFREQVRRVRGVESVEITQEPHLTVIVTARGDRRPRDIERDVRSLVAANVGSFPADQPVTIKVVPAPEVNQGGDRPIISWINTVVERDTGRIDVGIRWGRDETTGGAAITSPRRVARARAAAEAVAEAVRPRLIELQMKIYVTGTDIRPVGGHDWVLVSVVVEHETIERPLVGCARAEEGLASAGARAFLDAINRSLVR